MKRSLAYLMIVLLGALLAGCDTMMVAQYRIATDKVEKKKVLELLARVAAQIGLEERATTSNVQETLVFYSQPNVEHFRVELGARVVGDSIIVDLVGGFGPKTRSFERAKQVLREEIERAFPGRFDIPVPAIPLAETNQRPEFGTGTASPTISTPPAGVAQP